MGPNSKSDALGVPGLVIAIHEDQTEQMACPDPSLHDMQSDMKSPYELTEEDRQWLDLPPVGREII